MAKAELQIKGIEALKERLRKRKEVFKNALGVQLMQLGEAVVIHAKQNKGYKDRTANLKNSISYALFLDGKQITKSIGEGYNATYKDEHNKEHNNQYTKEEVMQMRSNALEEYAQKQGVVATSGYSLIIVAGMSYGKYVEDKGYNVLHLSKYYMKDEMRRIFNEVIERIKGE